MSFSPDHLGIAAVLMFVIVLHLLVLIRAPLWWPFKALMTVGSLAVVLLGYHQWTNSLGWPASDTPPAEMRFLWGEIVEPSPLTNDPGAIFVWIVPEGETRPRALRLPYSRSLHQKVEQGRERSGNGEGVEMHGPQGRRNNRPYTSQGEPDDLDFPPTNTPLPPKR